MKEQINKLALQAREHADSLLGKGLPDMVWQDEYHQKFAELIVKECAEVVQEGRWMVPPSQEQLARSIKQHFGVE